MVRNAILIKFIADNYSISSFSKLSLINYKGGLLSPLKIWERSKHLKINSDLASVKFLDFKKSKPLKMSSQNLNFDRKKLNKNTRNRSKNMKYYYKFHQFDQLSNSFQGTSERDQFTKKILSSSSTKWVPQTLKEESSPKESFPQIKTPSKNINGLMKNSHKSSVSTSTPFNTEYLNFKCKYKSVMNSIPSNCSKPLSKQIHKYKLRNTVKSILNTKDISLDSLLKTQNKI